MKRPATQIKSRFAKVNGVRLHDLAAGQGEPVIPCCTAMRRQPYVAAAFALAVTVP